MNHTIEIDGEYDDLSDAQAAFRANGIEARIRTSQYSADGASATHVLIVVQIVGAIAPVVVALIAAMRQSRKIVVEDGEKSIEVEGRSVEEVRELLATAQRVSLIKRTNTKLNARRQADTVPAMIATSYRYIVRRAGVRSSHAIVEGTRIGVHDVVAMTKTGASVDEVVASFPKLTRAQVYECLAYYERSPQ